MEVSYEKLQKWMPCVLVASPAFCLLQAVYGRPLLKVPPLHDFVKDEHQTLKEGVRCSNRVR